VQLARILLRFDPVFTRGVVHLAPILPEGLGAFRAENVLLDSARITINASGTTGSIEGLPPGLKLLAEPRPPLAYPPGRIEAESNAG
jgi:hypothetical protein